jgi:hypothetical protein
MVKGILGKYFAGVSVQERHPEALFSKQSLLKDFIVLYS